MIFVFDKVVNIMGKGKKIWLQILFLIMFSKGLLKVVIAWRRNKGRI